MNGRCNLIGWLVLSAWLAACSPKASLPPMATPQPTVVRVTPSRVPTTTPSRDPPSLATLRVMLTEDPCTAQDVAEYASAVLPLADEHLQDAAEARRMTQISDPDLIDEMYDRARARGTQASNIVPPPCAEKAHLKFSNALGLLLDVWDHIGEGEYELARRQLISSHDELAQAASLLGELEAELAGN
jgi:hypothetical protein